MDDLTRLVLPTITPNGVVAVATDQPSKLARGNAATEDAMTEYDVEEYIDKHGMTHLLVMIENICYGKAEHLRTNWQDKAMARDWERLARHVNKLAREDWPL